MVVDRVPGDIVAPSPDRDDQLVPPCDLTAFITSLAPSHRMMMAGRLSIIPFHTLLARS
jgi:hypothetical protein